LYHSRANKSLTATPLADHREPQRPNNFFDMASNDTFSYSEMGPIHEDGHVFRLILLHSGESDDEIYCTLFKAFIPQLGTDVPYEALSYAWGSSEKPEHIIVNEKPFMVTQNLFEALQNLRIEDEDRVLWIDAICIDQNHYKERNHQVRHMASIYREAERVIFWLGSSTYETDLLIGSLKRLERESGRVSS
jgi:hypothetical protein